MTNGSRSKGMATNKLPVFLLVGRAKACTPPSIVSVCDMAVMSSMGGRGGASAIAFVASMACGGRAASAPLIKPEQRSPADIAAALRREHTGELLTRTARHQRQRRTCFWPRTRGGLACCKALAIAHLYAQPPQQTGCKPSLSLGHNELGRMHEHTLRASQSYHIDTTRARRTPSSRGRPAPRARRRARGRRPAAPTGRRRRASRRGSPCA